MTILLPSAAVEHICHEEQMVIWSGDLIGALSMAGVLRDDLEYSEVAELHDTVKLALKSIIGMALDHPEARTILRQPVSEIMPIYAMNPPAP